MLSTSRASSRHVELARFVIGGIWLRRMPLASQRPRPTMGLPEFHFLKRFVGLRENHPFSGSLFPVSFQEFGVTS